MARKKGPTGPTPVDAITHGDKRANIPTADAEAFLDEEVEAVRKVRYERDETLDPQLVWRGKYSSDPKTAGEDDLVVDAPPIYIQEKIDPRVLIENLRRTAERPEDEPEMTLFDDFDGLEELDLVDFYQHDANWSNRMILGDSLQVMSSLAERERLRGKVQMIYIDPPYGIRFGSNWQKSARKRESRDGKLEDVAREVEQIKAFRDTWELGIHSYLSYLKDRMQVARELLSVSGSCFIQIGDANLHLVRSLADEIFGSANFYSLIALRSTPGQTADVMPGVVDYLIWYTKDRELAKTRSLFRERDPREQANLYGAKDAHGEICGYASLASASASDTTSFTFDLAGQRFTPPNGRGWRTNRNGMSRLIAAGRIHGASKTAHFVRYPADFPVTPLTNMWTDVIESTFVVERWYVVQTAAKIVERCILMTTDPGDLVLDPTCGSGTTAFSAERYGRRWITIDTSRVAIALARQRIMGAKYPWYLLADTSEGRAKEQARTTQALPRVQFGGDIRQGFVYERVQHITLKSIANNPDIKEGMTREAIDIAIGRHADSEQLYDRPHEDPKKVRVAGPFTVESLSPHRSLAFAGGPEASTHESASEGGAPQDVDGARFEQSILDNLAKAGIQNGRRAERITFAAFETFAGSYIQALGERAEAADAESRGRIAVAIGPQYGTVSPRFVKAAAREALAVEDVNLLCILAFAFEPQVAGVTEDDGVTLDASDEGFANVAAVRRLGRIPVLMVRMNADLLMGEELKKTGAGNLFTVFGEPDLEITDTADGVVVQLHGVDVYDPTTGEVRSKDTGQIALWMIDTDYNDDSFFVRHCYFTGGNDPYKRLKTALKADIDADAWASLYSTTSRPFAKPSTGKVAVKVINDYGDEVMKVFEV